MPSTVPHPRGARTSGLGVVLAGTVLVAATYGMARFGVGLFAPRIGAEHPELVRMLGYAAAAQFVSYAVASTLAGPLTDRRPRAGLVLAGATSTTGCLGVALASTPAAFVVSVFIGGMGAAFASPAMVRVVDAVVPERLAPTAQSMVNAGTAVGVVAAGVLAFATTSVATAWVVMAATCALAAGVLLASVRGRAGTGTHRGEPAGGPASERPTAPALPVLPALVVGAGSAVVWSFGPTLLTGAGAVAGADVGWLWVALGAGGLIGPVTGVVVTRLGPVSGWRVFAGLLAVANLALAWGVVRGSPGAAFGAMALFGAAYMCLSGVLILWARADRPDAAGRATAVLFIALAVGQALGALGFGPVRGLMGSAGSVLVAVALCGAGGALAQRSSSSVRWARSAGRS